MSTLCQRRPGHILLEDTLQPISKDGAEPLPQRLRDMDVRRGWQEAAPSEQVLWQVGAAATPPTGDAAKYLGNSVK